MAIIKMLQQVRVTTFEQKHRKSQQRKIQGRAKWNFRSKKQKHTHTHLRPHGTFAVVQLVTYGFIIKPVQILGGGKITTLCPNNSTSRALALERTSKQRQNSVLKDLYSITICNSGKLNVQANREIL